MPQPGQIIPEHRYPHNLVVVNDNTTYTNDYPEAVDDSTHMLFVFASPKGIDGSIQNIKDLKDFVGMYGEGPFSLYGQAYMNAYNAFSSGAITGHCLRVSADNASYSVSVLVGLYKIDETGKMTVKFKTRTPSAVCTDLNYLDTLYTAPTEIIPDGPDEGFKEVKLMTVAALGKGSYGRTLQYGISSNTGGDQENDFKNYIFEVYENESSLRKMESFACCFSENVILDDVAMFVDYIVDNPKTGSKRIKTLTNMDGITEIVEAYNDANEDSVFTVDDFDVFMGINKYTKQAIVNYEIDTMSEDIVNPAAAGGIALEAGDDGDLAENVDPATRKAVMEAKYLEAFTGEIDPMIFSKNKYPCHVILDADYPIDVKQAMAALAEKRGDCGLVIDCGTNIQTARTPIRYVKDNLDSYLRDKVENIIAFCGKVRDPISKKICTVTGTYALANRLPAHWSEYGGRHIPFAGNLYGVIDTDFLDDTIYPIYDEDLHSEIMDEMVDERINFARINANQRIVLATQTTRQTVLSNLSEWSNVLILLDIKRDCQKLCDSYQYQFSEPEDIARFNRDAESVTAKYAEAQVRSITAYFNKNDWEATRGIIHLYIEMIHKDLVKTTIIEIDVNRGSVSTAQ